MVINTNIGAQTAAYWLSQSSQLLTHSLARLSSGSNIVSPADDPAGLAMSTSLDAEINRGSAAAENVGNALAFSQTQDGFLQTVGNSLNRMSELAVMAQDVTKSSSDRGDYNQEFQTLTAYIHSVASMGFNTVSLFSGNALRITTDGDSGTYSMQGITASYLTGGALDLNSASDAATALTSVETAITQLATDRGAVGANISRLTYISSTLSALNENLSAANSLIADVDVAQESTQFAKYQILVQAGTTMLAQANTAPQSVLRLLS